MVGWDVLSPSQLVGRHLNLLILATMIAVLPRPNTPRRPKYSRSYVLAELCSRECYFKGQESCDIASYQLEVTRRQTGVPFTPKMDRQKAWCVNIGRRVEKRAGFVHLSLSGRR